MPRSEYQFFRRRSKARRLAMQAVYQWKLTGQDMAEVVEQFVEKEDYKQADQEHFRSLTSAVVEKKFNASLAECTEMEFEKVDPIEYAIIVNAAYEIVCCDDIDNAVAITEAIHLAKKFGGENSYQFVNGVLDCFAKQQMTKGE